MGFIQGNCDMSSKHIPYDINRGWKPTSLWKRNRPLCGAKRRDGSSCKAKAVWDDKHNKPINGQCRMHGGLSSGPKTKEGLKGLGKASSNRMKEYWRKKKPLHSSKLGTL